MTDGTDDRILSMGAESQATAWYEGVSMIFVLFGFKDWISTLLAPLCASLRQYVIQPYN